MLKKTKIWLITATSLVLMGSVIFCGVMSVFKWNFDRLYGNIFTTNSYEITEEFEDIKIKTNTANIILMTSESDTASVVCYEHKKIKHLVKADDGELSVEIKDTRKWFEYIGITVTEPEIRVYLPKSQYKKLSIKASTGDVTISKDFTFKDIDISLSTGGVKNYASASGDIKIKTTTGNIYTENISASNLELSVSTGGIVAENLDIKGDMELGVSTGKSTLKNISCKNLISKGSTGNMSMEKVIAVKNYYIKRSTGDIKFEGCDAAEIYIETDTGSVKGSLLTDKVFITETDTGSVSVPKSVAGGRCEISTDTGNINIKIIN